MSETYRSKRERWQRLLASLPSDLQPHISLRNVEAVASLTPRAQQRLVEAIQSGLKRLPRAVEQLRLDPNTSLAELLQPPSLPQPSNNNVEDVQPELADLIQLCFPDMPRLSAEALAGSDVMESARHTAQVHNHLFQSRHLRTDFVMTILFALLHRTLERLEEILAASPNLLQAIHQSDLPWKPNPSKEK
jgi:hypothetical protein